MTDEQINTAIAKALNADEHWMIQKDYCNDLNAMHEAEKVLGKERNHYIDMLGTMYKDSWEFATATARQRAEAFLRTLGKWEEAE
jgi:hypothetical protein